MFLLTLFCSLFDDFPALFKLKLSFCSRVSVKLSSFSQDTCPHSRSSCQTLHKNDNYNGGSRNFDKVWPELKKPKSIKSLTSKCQRQIPETSITWKCVSFAARLPSPTRTTHLTTGASSASAVALFSGGRTRRPGTQSSSARTRTSVR